MEEQEYKVGFPNKNLWSFSQFPDINQFLDLEIIDLSGCELEACSSSSSSKGPVDICSGDYCIPCEENQIFEDCGI